MRHAMLLLFALTACADTAGIGARGPYAPDVDRDGTAVDGLVVGHRLMSAGEYELARKAYLRQAAESGLTTDILSALGSAALHLGRLGQAETLFRRAIAEDPEFVPALNNLGVVLIETGRVAEAGGLFRAAFAADSGRSDSIRANLDLALEKREALPYDSTQKASFALVRRGRGAYLLLSNT